MVDLDWSTIAYQPRDLAWPLSCGGFTNHYLRGYRPLLCAGYHGDLRHIAGMVWPTVITNELFSILYSMEVAGVLCETPVGCLSIHNGIEALRHAHLHGRVEL